MKDPQPMQASLKDLEEQARKLPPDERAKLAKSLLESLADPAAAEAWQARNRAALEAYNDYIERYGVFSDGFRSF